MPYKDIKVVIYKITSPTNKIYIGQAWNMYKRIGEYSRKSCKHQWKLWNSLDKYGWKAHKFEICQELPKDISQKILNIYEIFYWQCYVDLVFNMLNLQYPGGNGKHAPESIQKMKDNAWLRGKFGKDHPCYGRIGAKNPAFGQPKTKKWYEKMTIKVINIETGEIFDSVKLASKSVNINISSLVKILKGNPFKKKQNPPLQYLEEYNKQK